MKKSFKVMTVSSFIEQNYSLTAEYQSKERWNLEQKQELILTLIEDFNVDPILLDYLRNEIIDGQQRTRAMINFKDNKFPIILKSHKVYYSDLSKKDRDAFLGYNIDIRCLEGTKEEMALQFKRSNKGTPLNHAEKRNAECSKFKEAINLMASEHPLFKGSINIKSFNDRHKYAELVTSAVFLEMKGIEKFSPDKLIKFFIANAEGINEDIAKRVTDTLDYMYKACKSNLEIINACTFIQMYLFVSKLVKSKNYVSPKEFGEFYFLESSSWRKEDQDYKNALTGGTKSDASMKTRFDKILNSYLKKFDPDFEDFNKMCYAKDAGRIIDVLSKVHNKRKQA